MNAVTLVGMVGVVALAQGANAGVSNAYTGPGGFVSDFSSGTPGVTQFQINVPDHGKITSVAEVLLTAFNHPFAGDLSMVLMHVDTGTAVMLLDRPGVPETEFGDDADFLTGNRSWQDGGFLYDADDFGASVTESILAPVSGSLSDFGGEDMFGTWRLTFTDHANAGTFSRLAAWSLIINTVPAPGVLALLGLGGLAAARRRPRR